MNILEPGYDPREAKLRYMDADFLVLSPGVFVTCAITGKPIPVEDLKYWNVDKQEAYIDADAALKAYSDNVAG